MVGLYACAFSLAGRGLPTYTLGLGGVKRDGIIEKEGQLTFGNSSVVRLRKLDILLNPWNETRTSAMSWFQGRVVEGRERRGRSPTFGPTTVREVVVRLSDDR